MYRVAPLRLQRGLAMRLDFSIDLRRLNSMGAEKIKLALQLLIGPADGLTGMERSRVRSFVAGDYRHRHTQAARSLHRRG